MKFTFERDSFLEKLALSSRFTSSRFSSISSLQGVLLSNKNGELEIRATNLISFFKTTEKTQEKSTGSFVIEPRRVVEFLSLLSPGKITMELNEKTVNIAQGRTKGAFPLMEAKDFPPTPNFEKEKEEKIKTEFFVKNLPLLLFTTSQDETRPVLTGVNFLAQDEELALVSTDGFRLSLLKTKKAEGVGSMLISGTFLEETLRFIKEEKEVGLSVSEKEAVVRLRVGKHEFYSRIIEGEFPPYEKVVPTEHKTRATLEREEFLKNVKISSVFARDFSNIILCEFKKSGVTLRPKIDGNNQNTTTQDAEVSGEEQIVAFNFKFLADFLNHANAKKITIEVLRPDAPVVFRMEGNKDFLHIIMPVRIQT